MTLKQCQEQLLETQSISTGMCKILGIPFETWLHYAQVPASNKDYHKRAIAGALAIIETKLIKKDL